MLLEGKRHENGLFIDDSALKVVNLQFFFIFNFIVRMRHLESIWLQAAAIKLLNMWLLSLLITALMSQHAFLNVQHLSASTFVGTKSLAPVWITWPVICASTVTKCRPQ